MAKQANTAESVNKSLIASSAVVEYLVVRRPRKIESLLMVLSDLEAFSERIGEDRSQDLGSAGTGGATGDDDDQAQTVAPRQKAIHKLPKSEVMRTRLVHHLEKDIRTLERKAFWQARHGGKGSAFLLNELHARMRKMQAFITEIVHSALEVVQRLYVRVFVDKQELV